jgi:DNA (cytosine-5)-methyltransferase 1
MAIPVIDLFAGPGGLNEGFSRVGESEGVPQFETVGSFEMETSAVNTLILRGTYRHLLRSGGVPDSYYEYVRGHIGWDEFLCDKRVAQAHEASKSHVHQVELGGDDDDSENLIREALDNSGVLGTGKPWVLIGGPPCQAYSLAGRSRRAKDETFAADKKHFLYREYLRILAAFAPPIFVMENVKGMLSSTSDGERIFEKIKADLESPGGAKYSLHSLVVDRESHELIPRDFVIEAELYGVPQRRHRVIIVGVRTDFVRSQVSFPQLAPSGKLVSVADALLGMPRLRSGISPSSRDSLESWGRVLAEATTPPQALASEQKLNRGARTMRREGDPAGFLAKWLLDPRLDDVLQHESRGHMIEDLKRYRFAATQAAATKVSPRLSEFPPHLQPNHKNAASESRPFEDRFRVQVQGKPSTTIVSHISKDGHYYIHPDPDQMRSLTVREAARLQTFPDNYFFVGNRTQQYHQVGNAVPPLLAFQIAAVVAEVLQGTAER